MLSSQFNCLKRELSGELLHSCECTIFRDFKHRYHEFIVPSGSLFQVQNSVVQVSDVVRTISGEGARLGSGFVYDNEGHIITNNHVVQTDSRNAQFDVTFSDGNAYTAQLVGSDPYSDLAVLKLQDGTA